jgi:hypothetical protein
VRPNRGADGYPPARRRRSGADFGALQNHPYRMSPRAHLSTADAARYCGFTSPREVPGYVNRAALPGSATISSGD